MSHAVNASLTLFPAAIPNTNRFHHTRALQLRFGPLVRIMGLLSSQPGTHPERPSIQNAPDNGPHESADENLSYPIQMHNIHAVWLS